MFDPVGASPILPQQIASPPDTGLALTGDRGRAALPETGTTARKEQAGDRQELLVDGDLFALSGGSPGAASGLRVPGVSGPGFAAGNASEPAPWKGFDLYPEEYYADGASGPSQVAEKPTFRKLLKFYINVSLSKRSTSARDGQSRRTVDGRTPSEPGATPGPHNGSGILDAILEIPIDESIGTLVTYVLAPTIGVDGLVSFSIVGFGNFAIIMSVDRQSLNLVDLETGRSVEVTAGEHMLLQGNRLFGPAGYPGTGMTGPAGPPSRLSLALQQVVGFILRSITDPFKVSLFLFLIVILSLWRTHGHDA